MTISSASISNISAGSCFASNSTRHDTNADKVKRYVAFFKSDVGALKHYTHPLYITKRAAYGKELPTLLVRSVDTRKQIKKLRTENLCDLVEQNHNQLSPNLHAVRDRVLGFFINRDQSNTREEKILSENWRDLKKEIQNSRDADSMPEDMVEKFNSLLKEQNKFVRMSPESAARQKAEWRIRCNQKIVAEIPGNHSRYEKVKIDIVGNLHNPDSRSILVNTPASRWLRWIPGLSARTQRLTEDDLVQKIERMNIENLNSPEHRTHLEFSFKGSFTGNQRKNRRGDNSKSFAENFAEKMNDRLEKRARGQFEVSASAIPGEVRQKHGEQRFSPAFGMLKFEMKNLTARERLNTTISRPTRDVRLHWKIGPETPAHQTAFISSPIGQVSGVRLSSSINQSAGRFVAPRSETPTTTSSLSRKTPEYDMRAHIPTARENNHNNPFTDVMIGEFDEFEDKHSDPSTSGIFTSSSAERGTQSPSSSLGGSGAESEPFNRENSRTLKIDSKTPTPLKDQFRSRILTTSREELKEVVTSSLPKESPVLKKGGRIYDLPPYERSADFPSRQSEYNAISTGKKKSNLARSLAKGVGNKLGLRNKT